MSQPFWRAYYIEEDPENPDAAVGLVRNLKINHIHFQENIIKGSGHHEYFGQFEIDGIQHSEENIEFKLTYPDRVLYFTGNRTNSCI